jgi:hypothetical protein
MSQGRTAGFDLVIEISETELNRQLATVPIPGFSSGTVVPIPVNVSGQNGTLTIMLNAPLADLDPPGPRDLRLSVKFTNGQLQLANQPNPINNLSGTIRIIGSFAVDPPYTPNVPPPPRGETKQAVFNFPTTAGRVTATFDGPSTMLLTNAGVDIPQLSASAVASIENFLRNSVRKVPLSRPIPVGSGAAPPPFDPLDFEIGKINTPALGRDALVFGVQTRTTTGGDITLITGSSLSADQAGIVLLGNDFVIRGIICPAIAGSLGVTTGPGSVFDDPCTLNTRIPMPGAPGTFIESLTARVMGGVISVTGSFSASGTGWNATGIFAIVLAVTCSSTTGITIGAAPPVVDITVNLEWWVYLLSVAAIAATFGLGAVTIGALLIAIADLVADSVLDPFVSGLAATALRGTGLFPITLPLGPTASGLTINACLLDDLTLSADFIYTEDKPAKSARDFYADPGNAFDLDNGLTSGTSGALPFGIDLTWDTGPHGLALRPRGGAAIGLGVTPPFDGFALPQIQRLFYSSNYWVIQALIPLQASGGVQPEFVFGVRTTEGRFAKCGAWRRPDDIIHFRYVTYDTETASLRITGGWKETRRESVGTGSRINRVEWLGVFKAEPHNMALPIDYQWCLCGQILGQGQGSLVTDGHTLSYSVDRDKLQIRTELGKNLKCELCVSAIDDWGRELFTCVPLDRPGTVIELVDVGEVGVLQSGGRRVPKYFLREQVELSPLTRPGIEFPLQHGARFDSELLPLAREALDSFDPRHARPAGLDSITDDK